MSPIQSRHTWAFILTSLVAPGCAIGQTDVVPGLSVHATPPRGVDTIVYTRSITREGRDSSSGTRTVAMRVIDGAGGPALLEVCLLYTSDAADE